MAKFFNAGTFYFPDRNDHNGCKDHVKVLEEAYAEAAVLADDAVNALNVLAAPQPSFQRDQIGFKKWAAKANMMAAYFKIIVKPQSGGPVDASRADWDNVNKLYKLIQAGFATDTAPGQTPALYCGTSGWKFITRDQPDPNDAPKLLRERKDSNGKEEFPEGVWHFNKHYKRPKAPKLVIPGEESHGLCSKSKKLIAVTSTNMDIITWCDAAFDPTTVPGGFKTKLPDKAKTNLLTDKGEITHSWTFLHELAHFYGGRPGIGLGTDGSGKKLKVIDQPVMWPDKANPGIKVRAAAYGAERVIALANDKDAATATHNADSYGTFAVAMHFPDFDWSTGTPVPIV